MHTAYYRDIDTHDQITGANKVKEYIKTKKTEITFIKGNVIEKG